MLSQRRDDKKQFIKLNQHNSGIKFNSENRKTLTWWLLYGPPVTMPVATKYRQAFAASPPLQLKRTTKRTSILFKTALSQKICDVQNFNGNYLSMERPYDDDVRQPCPLNSAIFVTKYVSTMEPDIHGIGIRRPHGVMSLPWLLIVRNAKKS